MMPPTLGRHQDNEDDAYGARGAHQCHSEWYAAATGHAKPRILDEFIAASGYHEKSAVRVLNETRTATAPDRSLPRAP